MELATITISILSVIISIIAILFTHKQWKRSFRPIVTAMVIPHKNGNNVTAYNLIVSNSGLIPATNIRITLPHNLDDYIEDSAEDSVYEKIKNGFEKSSYPIIKNSESVTCSFATTGIGSNAFWKPESRFTISIKYSDIFENTYKTRQDLFISANNSFTGNSWD